MITADRLRFQWVGQPASVSASAAIAAAAEDVWDAVCAPESTILMSRAAAMLAGVVPGTPVRQAGEMQYLISRLGNGELRLTVTMITELAAGRFALFSQVGRTALEMLYQVVPDGQGTRLELTFRWPAPASVPARQVVARSMADTVGQRVAAFKDLIETPGSPWASRRARP
jgi:hypothetical protein